MRAKKNTTTADSGLTKRAMVSLLGLAVAFLVIIFYMVTGQVPATGVYNFILIGIIASCVLFMCAGEPNKKR